MLINAEGAQPGCNGNKVDAHQKERTEEVITTPTTEQAIFAHAARRLEFNAYDVRTPAAKAAWDRDRQYFSENPTVGVRIRKVHRGECGVADAFLNEGPKITVWVVILHHIRLGDLRFSHGIGVWLFKLDEANPEVRAAILRTEARRLVRRARLPLNLDDLFVDEDEEDENDEEQALQVDEVEDI